MHYGPLITIIVSGLSLAFVFGAIAHRLGLSPLVGFLLTGIVVGPFTPGFVANQDLANQLAEIGIILLMFGVGLHFSLKDLFTVRSISIPGAIVQMGFATFLGLVVALFLGWDLSAGLVFGLALSVASTVVLLRALQEHRLTQAEIGKIAVGWLIVEDLAMVLALVLLPALAANPSISDISPLEGPLGTTGMGVLATIAFTIIKVVAFVAFMLVVGRKVIPMMLHWVAHTGSKELFRLAVLATALGVAFLAAKLFGVSFALGAFFAGMILSESHLSQRAAHEILPLRDAFAVLFFVSVGMLFDPWILFSAPWQVLATLGVILIGKSLAAWVIVRASGRSNAIAFTISASLAQIGEFSFILVGLGVSYGVLPEQGRDLILAGAIGSILLNPFIFGLSVRYAQRESNLALQKAVAVKVSPEATSLTGHVVLVGFGQVGQLVGSAIVANGEKLIVIDNDAMAKDRAVVSGKEAICANAILPETLELAGLRKAKAVIVAIPNSTIRHRVCEVAKSINSDIEIIARADNEADKGTISRLGATSVVVAYEEIARAMVAAFISRDAALCNCR